MKVYRIIQDSFLFENDRGKMTGLKESKNICTEDIYYNMGYVTLNDKKHDRANTASKMLEKSNDINKMGKYFYVFAENAILQSYTLIFFTTK